MSDLSKYPKTKTFEVIDTMGVPHPYCITAKHVGYAADNCCGILNNEAIIEAEKKKIYCGICNGELSFKQHETALLINIKSEEDNPAKVPGLQEYLLSIKEQCEKDGYAGFAFIKNWHKPDEVRR